MKLIAFVLIITITTANLKVRAPQTLVDFFEDKYPNGSIPYSLANYGKVPYGKTISAQLGIPEVLEDCVMEEIPE